MKQGRLTMNGPTSTIQEALSHAGFIRDPGLHPYTYRMDLEAANGVTYVFQLPYEEREDRMKLIGEASFFDGVTDLEVPADIREAALRRLSALQIRIRSDSLKSYKPSQNRNHRSSPLVTRSIANAINGSMVQDFADAKRLGEDMQHVKTSSELRQEGLVPDPIQY